MKIDKKNIIKLLLLLFLLFLAIGLMFGKQIRRIRLAQRITHNLKMQYHSSFICDSLSIYGDGVNFVCHPKDDSTLMFDGFGDSRSGSISYDTYPGAIIAKEDTAYLSELLLESFSEVFVYGDPRHRGGYKIDEMISSGNYTLDDLHKMDYAPELFFYVFINPLSTNGIYDYENEYNILEQSIGKLTGMYKEKYEQDVCVVMHIYFIDSNMIEYTSEYFENHLSPDYVFENEIKPQGIIHIQMGAENGFYSESLRMTKEEYIEERERMR